MQTISYDQYYKLLIESVDEKLKDEEFPNGIYYNSDNTRNLIKELRDAVQCLSM